MSLRKASQKFGIPKSTICDYKNQKYKHTKLNHNRLLSDTEEVSVANYLKWMANQVLPVTRKVLKCIVKDILAKKSTIWNLQVVPSKKWCQRFMRKYNLKSKKPRQISSGRLISKEQILSFFQVLSTKIGTYSPSVIYNIDETGFSKQTDIQAPVIAPSGSKPMTRDIFTNDHVTSVHCISAAGQNMSPLIIFSKRVPRSLQGEEPRGWLYRSTNSGFINSEIFIDWFNLIFLKEKPKDEKSLLIMDAHSTHVSLPFFELAVQHNVEVVTLPSKSSHILQPLDQIFGPLKETFAQTALTLKYVNGNILTNTSKFPHILKYAMDKAWSVHVIKTSFLRTGITSDIRGQAFSLYFFYVCLQIKI